MDPELASFVLKFQDLCSSGKNATLSLSSSSGRVYANLSIEIGYVKSPQKLPVSSRSPTLNTHHVSPSRKRRMERRAESRKLFAEEAKNDLTADELNVLEAAEKAVDDSLNSSVLEESLKVGNDNIVVQSNLVQKEDCENDSVIDTTAVLENLDAVEETDSEELARDKLVNEVIIYAVPPSDCRKSMQDAEEVEKEIKERFSLIGVEVLDMKIRASRTGKFESSLVKITPVNLRRIWGRRLGLLNCAIVEHKKPK